MNCPTYPKIETLFERDEKSHVNTSELRRPEFALIHHWLVTEKIDGTNIRVALETPDKSGDDDIDRDDFVARFYGRTDKAQIPKPLLTYLQETITVDKMLGLCKPKKDGQVEYYPMTLYGEGYGAGIQKGGGNYREGVSFRLFDVLVDGKWWLDWENVAGIAESLGIKTVPVIQERVNLEWITSAVQNVAIASRVAREDRDLPVSPIDAEGIVARTDPYLFDKHGHPLRFKLKTRDFPKGG